MVEEACTIRRRDLLSTDTCAPQLLMIILARLEAAAGALLMVSAVVSAGGVGGMRGEAAGKK